MSDNKSFNFKSFVLANNGRSISCFDYLHAVYKSHRLTADFIFCFAKLFWPDFKVIDGLIFISELFDEGRYRDLLNENRNSTEVQFWMNLLEITGLFDELTPDEAISFAEIISASWNSKLKYEFGTISVPARVIHDDDTGEVFVTIGFAD